MITSETITAKQIRDAAIFATDAERGPFGSAENFYNIASRRVDDTDAYRLYGEVGVRNTQEARALCAEVLNRRAKESRQC